MIEKKDNQIIVMWSEDFERLKQKKTNNDFELIVNVVVIDSKDYEKFFQKIK